VAHLGDYIYEHAFNGYNVREWENLRQVTGGETLALETYRNRHALYHTDLDLQAAPASAPLVVTWDDHEVENNYAGPIDDRPPDRRRHGGPAERHLQHRRLRDRGRQPRRPAGVVARGRSSRRAAVPVRRLTRSLGDQIVSDAGSVRAFAKCAEHQS